MPGAPMNNYPSLLQFDYLEYARQFYKAFGELPPRPPLQSWPRYLMLCHSIELALKAYLAAHGFTVDDLREGSIRHNLTKLLTEAMDKGLSISQSTQDDIKKLHEAHDKYWHRYPHDPAQFCVIEHFERAAGELIKCVANAITPGGRAP